MEAIAGAIADRLWTIDGEPWEEIVAGGSCGPSRCTLELSGSAPSAAGEDLWVFAVEPASGTVEIVTPDLHSVSNAIAADLDRRARAADAGADGVLEGLLFSAVRWLPPPAEDRFRLAYRSGNEEESCAVDLELDAAGGRITDVVPSGC